MAVVYRHIRLDKNEPFYIGIGKNYKRPFSTKNRNRYWKNIINKTNYKIDILFDDLSWEEAQEKEKEFIKLYGRRDLGLGTLVNLTDGGEGFLNEIRKGKTYEEIYGEKKGKELRKKRSIETTGRKHSEETKEKIRKKSLIYTHTEETKEKIRQLKLGKPSGRKGCKLSEEHKMKLKEAWKKRKQLL